MHKNECNDTVEYTYVCYTSLTNIYIYNYIYIVTTSLTYQGTSCHLHVTQLCRRDYRACRVPQHIPQLPDVFMFQLDSLKK